MFGQNFSKNLIFENEGKLILFCPATSRDIKDALKPNDTKLVCLHSQKSGFSKNFAQTLGGTWFSKRESECK
jgi:hypothetical protein